jgi:hypothetical protein
MKRHHLVSIGAIVFALCILGPYWFNSSYYKLVEKCKQIELGVSEEVVISTLRIPDRTRHSDRKGRSIRHLEYDAPSIVATVPYVLIDEISGRVTEIVCDDTYHLQSQS